MTSAQQTLRPKDILVASLEKTIIVKLKSQKLIRGTLNSFDQHLNLYLTNSYEMRESNPVPLGDVVIRGDNVIMLVFPEEEDER